jgi:hypothetical protein
MNTAGESFVESRKFALLSILMIGSVWGLVECTAGVSLRGACTRFYSGSILTGTSLIFLACAYMTARRLPLVMLMPIIAGVCRVYAGVLLGQPLISGAVANPVYAFFGEAVAFCAVMYLIKETHVRSYVGAGLAGITAAVLAANLFLPVRLVTGISACVVPGTDFPLCIWGLPIAAAIAAVGVPTGLRAGAWIRHRAGAVRLVRRPVLSGLGIAVSAGCAVLITILNIR